MHPIFPPSLVASALLMSAASVRAQPPADPSGRWAGTHPAPLGETRIDLDLAGSASGDPATFRHTAGTFNK